MQQIGGISGSGGTQPSYNQNEQMVQKIDLLLKQLQSILQQTDQQPTHTTSPEVAPKGTPLPDQRPSNIQNLDESIQNLLKDLNNWAPKHAKNLQHKLDEIGWHPKKPPHVIIGNDIPQLQQTLQEIRRNL